MSAGATKLNPSASHFHPGKGHTQEDTRSQHKRLHLFPRKAQQKPQVPSDAPFRHPPSVWRLSAEVRRYTGVGTAFKASAAANDVLAIGQTLSEIAAGTPSMHKDAINLMAAAEAVDTWEHVCRHLVDTEAISRLVCLGAWIVVNEAAIPSAKQLALRMWAVDGVVDMVLAFPPATTWLLRWLELVYIDTASGALNATTMEQRHRVQQVLDHCLAAGAPPPSPVFEQLDRTLLVKCLTGVDIDMRSVSDRWRTWFGASASTLLADALGDTIVLPFCSVSAACLAAYDKKDTLACLRLCLADASSDAAYLALACKRKLHLQIDAAEWAALPPPASLLALHLALDVVATHDESIFKSGGTTTPAPWLAHALALVRIAKSSTAALSERHAALVAAHVVQAAQVLEAHASIERACLDRISSVSSSNEPKPALSSSSSSAKSEWQRRKSSANATPSSAMDALMDLVGLENIKHEFLRLYDFIQLQKMRDMDVKLDRFSIRVVGNSGVGKSTVADLYAEFLGDMKALAHGFYEETDAQAMIDAGLAEGYSKPIQTFVDDQDGGVFAIDRAGTLDPASMQIGRSIVSAIQGDLERLQGKVAWAFMGTAKELDTLFGYSTRLAHRVPVKWVLGDFDEDELLQLFQKLLQEREHRFTLTDGGFTGNAAKIVARRLASQRGPDFGNAHAVAYQIDVILRRQAERLQKERLAASAAASVEAPPTAAAPVAVVPAPTPDYFSLTFADVVGPNPFTALETSAAYKQLMAMVGLGHVKRELAQIIHAVRENYERELVGKPKADIALNRIFIGSPGTGRGNTR
jgi:hypothetical protein